MRVPGSKSISNRVLLLAALAAGTSNLQGVLRSDDTDAMLAGLADLEFHRGGLEMYLRSMAVPGCFPVVRPSRSDMAEHQPDSS